MMATLLDQVNQALDEKKPENRYVAMVEEIENHLKKVTDLQSSLLKSLADLEKEESRKITSEGIHTGFDSTHISKSTPSTSGEKKTESKVELLNPNFSSNRSDDSKTTESANDDGDIDASPDAVKFGKIKASSYRESHEFLVTHPHILTEKETEGLLVLAFESQLENKDDVTRNYIHQALLIQYCRALGKDGLPLFFKRITTKDHKAQEVFYKDVQDTYFRIKNRAAEINKERASGANKEVEQIQLYAVDPGTEIKINVPPENSEDPEEKRAREIFEGFAPDMRKAIESGNLDKVNEVLGEMKVPEAEELVELFSEVSCTHLLLLRNL
jgi:cell division cycle protein 37